LVTGPSSDDLHVSRVGERTVLECAGFETDAAQVWIRRDRNGGVLRHLALADATRLIANGQLVLVADGLEAISFSFQPDGIRGTLECAGEFRLRLRAPGFTRARLADQEIKVQHDGEFAEIVSHANGLLQLSLTR
jgi:hypothetical protein